MYRQPRRTEEWLIQKEPIKEHVNTRNQLTINTKTLPTTANQDTSNSEKFFQKTTSFNFAKVPFGSGIQRFVNSQNQLSLLQGFITFPQAQVYTTASSTVNNYNQQQEVKHEVQGSFQNSQEVIYKNQPVPGGPTFFNNSSIIHNKNQPGGNGSIHQQNQLSAVFKTKQPRIGFHYDLEKKIRETHTNLNEGLEDYQGRDQQLDGGAGKRIKVKINDEIMNADDLGRSRQSNSEAYFSTIPGSLKRGSAFHSQTVQGFNINKQLNLPKVPQRINRYRLEDLQNTASGFNSRNKALITCATTADVGPGSYNIKDTMIFKNQPSLPLSTTGRQQSKNIKVQMEGYLQEVLNLRRPGEMSNEARDPKPSFTDNMKPLSILQSKTLRHDQTINKNLPGPGSYINIDGIQKENKSQFKKEVQNFGTLVQRDFALLRDPNKQPYKDPSFKYSPSPQSYLKPRSIEQTRMKNRERIMPFATFVGQVPGSTVFKSKLKRDILGTVSKDYLQTPGPGSYEPPINQSFENTSLLDKYGDVKPLKDAIIKTNLNPFGSSMPRFRYKQSSSIATEDNILTTSENLNDQFSTQLIDVSKKGGSNQGILSSISAIASREDKNKQHINLELVKDFDNRKQSSMFKSSVERFSDLKIKKKSSDQKEEQTNQGIISFQNKAILLMNDFKTYENDTARMFRKNNTQLSVVPENESIGNQINFIQINTRHSNEKNPGNGMQSKAPRFKYEKNSIPGPGQYEQNLDSIASDSPFSSVKKGQGIFKARSRNLELIKSHTTSVLNPTVASDEVIPSGDSPGPGAYFCQVRPFLKKSYNATLPAKKFY